MLGQREQDAIGLVTELDRPVRPEDAFVGAVDGEVAEGQVRPTFHIARQTAGLSTLTR
ncbi:MAG: hypothetical protein ACXWUN_06090 [Allosphingosinicella sp.]